MIITALQTEIEGAIKMHINSIAPLSAANNAQIYRLNCSSRQFVAKVAEKGLDVEAWMLSYLKEKSNLSVPEIYYSNEHIIVMSYFAVQHSLDAVGQKNAAEQIASLHKVRADMFGLERDTMVGSLPQPNPQTKDWITFFGEHRLLYMARAALDEGKIDKSVMMQVEKLVQKLGQHIDAPPYPALIHGDIWSGNVLPGKGCVAAFLDPAIYYADPEVELAFIRLFNTFDETFFTRYNEINQIRAGFKERSDIYNIYPLLVHARLFGASYARKALKLIEKFV